MERFCPGIAAETCLAFILDDTPAAPKKVVVDIGTKAQSVPGPGEQPQIFETVETIEARPEWNLLKPKCTQKQELTFSDKTLYLKGANLQLKPGDGILIIGDERKTYANSEEWDIRILNKVTPDQEKDWTVVEWLEGLGHINKDHKEVDPAHKNVKAYVFRQRAAFFGHNAPDPGLLGKNNPYIVINSNPIKTTSNDWPFTIDKNILLDAAYPKILKGSWLVLTKQGTSDDDFTELYLIEKVNLSSKSDYAISSETTQILLSGCENVKMTAYLAERLSNFGLRDTTVYAQSEELELAETPFWSSEKDNTRLSNFGDSALTPVDGAIITLDRYVPELLKGQSIIVCGKPIRVKMGIDDEVISETATLDPVPGVDDEGKTVLYLKESLKNMYDRSTVSIYANVVRATHGETRQEVLGSADAASSFQQMALHQAPLTFTPAATPTGSEDTLQIRVNDILWDKTPTLYGAGPRDRVFTAHAGADGKVLVQFGDGVTGTRPPRGMENISATYRIGLGAAGNVKDNQLRILLSRLLGVRSVNNPQPATGGVDPEETDEARRNVPYTALTLERIVSLHDYEDFARSFGGVAKAHADWLWDGSQGVIFLTVIAAEGRKMDDDSLQRLRQAIDNARDPAQHVQVETTDALRFHIQARLVLNPRYRVEQVLDAAKAALHTALALKRRDFGQDVTESEILGQLQAVDGVNAADLERPYPGSNLPDSKNEWNDHRRLIAENAQSNIQQTSFSILPAELWIMDKSPESVTLRVVSDLNEPEQKEGTA